MASNTPLHFSRFSYFLCIIFFSFVLFFDTKDNFLKSLRIIQTSSVITIDLMTTNIFNFFSSWLDTKDDLKKTKAQLKSLEQAYEFLLARQFIFSDESNLLEGDNLVPAFIKNFDAYRYICCGVHEMLISENSYLYKPVLNSSGLIGQLVDSEGNYGKLILLSDSRHYLPVSFGSIYCNANGRGMPMDLYCTVEKNSFETNDILGLPVFTSGLGGIFPKGLMVGSVSRVTTSENSTEISISLLADPRTSPNIYIIKT
jgi:cell shape-determining protein MreC